MSGSRITLFVVGDVGVICRALEAVLPADRFDVQGTSLDSLSDLLLHNNQPALAIAATPVAWRTLRPANVWPTLSTLVRNDPVFEEQSSDHPASVLRTTPIDPKTLSDVLLSGEGPGSLIRNLIQHSEQSDSRTPGSLLRAALRPFTLERHNVPVEEQTGVGSHQAHDAHAALRFIHGATLAGWMRPKQGRDAYEQVCEQAAPKSEDYSNEKWPGAELFDATALEALPPPVVEPEPEESFGRIVVVDDQPFWETTLDRLWSRFGFEVERVERPEKIRRMEEDGVSAPIRAIVLDLKHPSDPFAGGRYLGDLNSRFENIPIIVLSVEDRFSSTVLLKRKGAFLYVSKHPEARLQGYRDEVTAFGQFLDAVLLSAFASLKNPLTDLWEAVLLEDIFAAVEDSPSNGPGFYRIPYAAYRNRLSTGSDVGELAESLKEFSDKAFDTLFEECQSLFHDAWQGTGSRMGLACRQIIRSVGLANDKWSEVWKRKFFNPDRSWEPWAEERTSPLRTYHHLTTKLRNRAAHARTSDDRFDWRDVWIAVLTFVLKVEGLARKASKSPNASRGGDDEFEMTDKLESRMGSLLRPLGHLLTLSGHIDNWPVDWEEKSQNSEICGRLASLRRLRKQNRKHIEKADYGEYVPEEGWDKIPERQRLAAMPYILRASPSAPLVYETQQILKADRSEMQHRADCLLLWVIASRTADVRD
jgi:CheY-like chemotaxis protein